MGSKEGLQVDCRRKSPREGPSEKVQRRKIRERRSVGRGEGPSRKVRWRRSSGEGLTEKDPRKKVCQRRSDGVH